MLPEGILLEHQISLDNPAASKKKTLEIAAELLAAGDQLLSAELVYEKLLERERLGSTGLANGIALPHARMKGVTRPIGALIRLTEGVDFDALDEQPVDLIFALLVPEAANEEHLNLLADLARMFRDSDLRQQIRQSTDNRQIVFLLTEPHQSHATTSQGS